MIGGDPQHFHISSLYDPMLQDALYNVAESIQKMNKLCVGTVEGIMKSILTGWLNAGNDEARAFTNQTPNRIAEINEQFDQVQLGAYMFHEDYLKTSVKFGTGSMPSL